MNVRCLISVVALALCMAPSWAQRKRSSVKRKAAPVVVVNVDSLMQNYEFQQAEKELMAQITHKHQSKESALREEEQLSAARKALQMMGAVERVVIVDSLMLPRERVSQALAVGGESGKVMKSSDLNLSQDAEAMLFQSELGDQMIYAVLDPNGILQLYSADVLGNELEGSRHLNELNDGETVPTNYPFMMADGTTLYFSKQDEAGLGGYDIYMTRYDAEEKHFLIPENIGMPFNSPANDYLFCVDESNNIGCFVTDRNMPADSVCVYYFIPNEARRVYVPEEVGEEALRQLARICNIRLTWGEEAQVKAALLRLQQSRSERTAMVQSENSFVLHVADNRTVCSLDEIEGNARQLAQTWLDSKAELQQLESQLAQKRNSYAIATQGERVMLANDILAMEKRQEILVRQVAAQENDVRRAILQY